jgi:hypothetical protein
MVTVAVIKNIKRVEVMSSTPKTGVANVIVANKKTVQVSADNSLGIIDSTAPVNLVKTPTIVSLGVQKIEELNDVNSSNKVQGATLVYDYSNNNYVATQLDMDYITGGLHGGTF